MGRGTRSLAVAALAAGSIAPTAAQADTNGPLFNCRASAVYESLAGNNRIEPIVANGSPNTAGGKSPDFSYCADADTGFGNLASPAAIPGNVATARTANAVTDLTPETGSPVDQKGAAFAVVEQLALPLGGATVVLGATSASAAATVSCVGGTPKLEGTSQLLGLTLAGTPISLDAAAGAIATALAPLGPIVDVKVNEQVKDATSLTQRALHIKVLQAAGATPVLDVVVAEARVVAPAGVCTRASTGSGTAPVTGSGSTAVRPCPPGAEYEAASNLCVITRTSQNERIVVGRPFEGPSGGTVVALPIARKKFRSACLAGTGTKYAIVGSNKADRITGTNGRDRILGRGGNDKVDGGRGEDCLDGGKGGDLLSGAIGADKVLGMSGRDALNGGAGSDRLEGGSGNDTINAAYGADIVKGGSGSDFINVATAGKRAKVFCGAGRDKVRFNYDERRTVRKDCEVRYAFADRPRK